VAQIPDIRICSRPIRAAETLTSDNISVGCKIVICYRGEDPKQIKLEVTDDEAAISGAANALKGIIGSLRVRELLGEREKLAGHL
jgi:regulator of protease activity HflC (stomatin/prohibitin superfamily)